MTYSDEAGDYAVPNVLGQRDCLVFRPDIADINCTATNRGSISNSLLLQIFSSPEPKVRRYAYSIPMVRRPSVVRRRPSSSTISNMNISATSGLIATKFYLKRDWVGGKAA